MKSLALRVVRVASLVLLASLATSLLMYFAPGYFSDSREMDASHAAVVRSELNELRAQQGSPPSLFRHEMAGWLHGDLGVSRHFGLPVSALLHEALPYTAKLLLIALPMGWCFAFLAAVVLSAFQRHMLEITLSGLTALLMALPVGALATLCLVANWDRPTLVLAAVIAVRDFKLLHRFFQTAWRAPHIVHARANGLREVQIAGRHLLPTLRREVLSVAAMSIAL
ncbi:MAG: hypothetical protein INR62_08510, partial [Rhodospirillales bacterium]|nr:hypothetical protein [Acetobacter sp.]